MEDLIPLINRLQSVFKKTGMQEIKLPQIVVVGAQSSGKSSVLESLVKKSFLPRGTGIVTRCPIILQLNHIRGKDEVAGKSEELYSSEEWCRFSKTPDKKYTDFDEVRRAIEVLQVEMAGDKKGISMEPIILEVFSPNVIDLTVVDLPGIVKLALEGQPEDIEDQVLEMIMRFIKDESAIILAVSAANADIATSESIKIANKVDPDGNRTIAVVTKLDLMDKGTDAAEVLRGDIIKVKLGIIGVVNRSQEDINNNTTVENAHLKEESFLSLNYPNIHAIGTPYLAKRLNYLLKEHINNNLPDLIKRIADLTRQNEDKLQKLGKEISTKPEESAWIIMETIVRFTQKMRDMAHSRPSYAEGGQEHFPVRVNNIFKTFRDNIIIEELDLPTLQRELSHTINFEGFSSIEEVFKRIVKEGILKMKYPAIQCAKDVHSILSETASSCFDDDRLSKLNATIQGVLDELLDSQLENLQCRLDIARAMVDGIAEYIEIQIGMISSSDESFVELLSKCSDSRFENDFCKFRGQIAPPKFTTTSTVAFPMSTHLGFSQMTDDRTQYTHDLIMKYLQVIKRELADYIPKYLMFYLARKTIDKVSESVKLATLGKEKRLVIEPEEITLQRTQAKELLKSLRDASQIIREIRTGY